MIHKRDTIKETKQHQTLRKITYTVCIFVAYTNKTFLVPCKVLVVSKNLYKRKWKF